MEGNDKCKTESHSDNKNKICKDDTEVQQKEIVYDTDEEEESARMELLVRLADGIASKYQVTYAYSLYLDLWSVPDVPIRISAASCDRSYVI